MPKYDWKDTTSYSRNEEKGKVEPRTWTLKAGDAEIVVTRHMECPGEWKLVTRGILSVSRIIGPVDIESAKASAIRFVKSVLNRTIQELD